MHNHFKFPLIVFALIFSAPLFAQKVTVGEIAYKTQQIGSIDLENADIAAIAEAIGDARVVMLGEQSHGDGETFKAKAAIVKYLHEKKGFSVLAFESDMFALEMGTISLSSDSLMKFWHNNLYPIWSQSEQMQPLLKYILNADKFRLTGFDSQAIGNYSASNLKQYLQTMLSPLNAPDERERLDFILRFTDTIVSQRTMNNAMLQNFSKRNKKNLEYYTQSLATYIDLLARNQPKPIDIQMLRSLMGFARQSKYSGYQATILSRDSAMAANVKWIVDHQYAHQKIIIWAASGHTAKDALDLRNKPQLKRMGWWLHQLIDTKKVYSIAFTSREGSTGIFKENPILPPVKDSYEINVPSIMSYGFLDLRPFRSAHVNFIGRFYGHEKAERDWASVYDGIFYIKTNHYSKKINGSPKVATEQIKP